MRWLRDRPEATLCVDRYSDAWEELAWVQLVGGVTLLDPAGAPEAARALAQQYAPYREHPPRGPLLRLDPERMACWSAAKD